MKKTLLLIAILCLTAMLFSCQVIDTVRDTAGDIIGNITGDNAGQGDGGNNSVEVQAAPIWSADITATLVYGEECNELSTLSSHIADKSGRTPETASSDLGLTDNEIVIGNVGRSISDTAYLKLDRFADFYSLEESGESAYLIYAEDGSMAIAYSDVYARYAAVKYIVENLTDPALAVEGVVACDSFNTVEFIAAEREAARDAAFAAAETEIGKEAADILRQLYDLFDEGIYTLIADLYDPEVGGFYYSTSARDAKRYLPDVESTGQALAIIDAIGLSCGAEGVTLGDVTYYYPDFLSEDMIAQLYSFVGGLRAPNGYFYHKQWGTSINTIRKESDRAWGELLLSVLGGGAESDAAAAAAEIIPAAEQSITDEEYAVAQDTLRKYLDKKLSQDSYTVSEDIKANFDSVKSFGLYDFLAEYLGGAVMDNGLFEDNASFAAVNALVNFMDLYGGDLQLTCPETAVNTAIELIVNTELEVATIYDIHNCWVVIDRLLPTLTEEQTAEVNATMAEQRNEILYGTFDKLSVFKTLDGGFSTNPDSSGQYYKDMLCAVAGSDESDMNATYIAATTAFEYMLPYLGISAPDMYCDLDVTYFLNVLAELDSVIKDIELPKVKPIISDIENYDFESGILETTDKCITVYNALSDKVDSIDSASEANSTEGSFLSIVTDPTDATNKVLKSYVNDGLDSYLTLNPYNRDSDGDILVFEFDYSYERDSCPDWQGIDHFIINFADDSTVTEQAIFKATLKDLNDEGYYTTIYRGGNISGDAGVALNVTAGQWIKIRAVIDEFTHKMDIYMSSDGGETWLFCLNKQKDLSDSPIISMTLKFTATVAENRVEYFDNVSFVRMNFITFNSNIGYKEYGIVPVDTIQ